MLNRARSLQTAMAFMMFLLPACLLLCTPVTAKAFVKGDPDSGTQKVYVDNGSKDDRFLYCGDDTTYTRWRYVDGVPAYCLNPACGSRDSGYMDARTLLPSDFSSEKTYRRVIATLYYSPGGPGYESAGKALFPTKRFDGGAMDESQRMATSHVLMAYYYNNRTWSEVWYRHDNTPVDPTEAYTAWLKDKVIPSSEGTTLADKIEALTNDADMLANGGYTFDEFANRVIIVLTGYIGDWPYQDLITWEKPERGALSLLKESANADISANNACYSLKGAVYGIFSSEADAKTRNAAKAVRTGTTGQKNADGSQSDNYFTTTEELVVGTYWVTEITPSRGFARDDTVYKVTVKSGSNTRVNASKSHVEETPLFGSAAIWAAKLDAGTGSTTPQGSASLSGAEFTIRYYDGQYTASNLPEKPVRTWVVKTGADGKATMNDVSRAGGDAFYHHGGKVVIPLGTLSIVETKAPAGYLLDDGSGGTPKVHIVNITGENGALTGDYNAPTVKNTVKHFGFTVAKIDELMQGAQAEGDATLDGAVFSVVNTSQNPVMVNGKSYGKGQECLEVTTANASGKHIARVAGTVLPYGSYLIREKTPPTGYLPNADWSLTLKTDEKTADGTVIDLTGTPCKDMPIRGGVAIPKIDRELKESLPLGAATLSGAEMTITLESDQPVKVDGSVFKKGDTVKVIETKEDGTASTGANDLPYGTYSVRETKAPTGYLLNEAWSARVEVREEGVVYATPAVDDQAKRGDIRFNKANGETMGRLGGVAFLVTSKTTGESHVVVTDENGSLDTSSAWAKHSHQTNANDEALGAPAESEKEDVEEASQEAETKGETQGSAEEDAGESGDAGKGGNAESKAETEEDSGADDARESAEASGEESGSEQASNAAFEVDDAKLDAEAGIWFHGRTDRTTAPDDALGALPYDTYLFKELRGAANVGMQPVEFEVRVYRDGYDIDMGTVDDSPADIGINTELKTEDGMKIAPATADVRLIDTVSYHGLEKGKTYELRGVLMDGDTEEEARVGDEAITGKASFTPSAEKGQVEVEFHFDASELAGKRLVAFQELYLGKALLAEHKDLGDDAQTVGIPRIATVLSVEDGAKELIAEGPVALIDRVDYTALAPGRTYTLSATLHAKAQDGTDGGVMKDAKGNEITARAEFSPDTPSGNTNVTFTFEASLTQAVEAVAFEELACEGVVYATHADINDESQTATLRPKPKETPQEEPSKPEAEPKPEPEEAKTPTPTPQTTPTKSTTPVRTSTPSPSRIAKSFVQTGDKRALLIATASLLSLGAAASFLLARRRQTKVRQIDWVWENDSL